MTEVSNLLQSEGKHDPQDTPLYSRSDAAASGGPVCHGGGRHAPPHGGVSRPVSEGAGAAQGVCGHQERCAAAVLLGHGRDGGVGVEPDLAGRQGAGADGGQIWRALDGPGEGVQLRAGRADGALRADLRPGAGARRAQAGAQGGLHAGHGDFDGGAPRYAGHCEAARRDGAERAAGGGRHHRPRHDALRRGWLGHRRADRRLAEGGDDSAGPGVSEREREGVGGDGDERRIRATTSTCARSARTR